MTHPETADPSVLASLALGSASTHPNGDPMNRRGFLTVVAGGAAAFALSACDDGTSKNGNGADVPDCDADDLAEGDSDCGTGAKKTKTKKKPAKKKDTTKTKSKTGSRSGGRR